MTVAQFTAARDAARQALGRSGAHVFDDFIIYRLPDQKAMIKLLWGGVKNRIRPRA